jgi:hypothetical protein
VLLLDEDSYLIKTITTEKIKNSFETIPFAWYGMHSEGLNARGRLGGFARVCDSHVTLPGLPGLPGLCKQLGCSNCLVKFG